MASRLLRKEDGHTEEEKGVRLHFGVSRRGRTHASHSCLTPKLCIVLSLFLFSLFSTSKFSVPFISLSLISFVFFLNYCFKCIVVHLPTTTPIPTQLTKSTSTAPTNAKLSFNFLSSLSSLFFSFNSFIFFSCFSLFS